MEKSGGNSSQQPPSGVNPFECPICFEYYSAVHVPTTLPCGHSCCILHTSILYECFACRSNIGDIRLLRPTYALRDGAILYLSLYERFNSDLNSLDTKCSEITPNDDQYRNLSSNNALPLPAPSFSFIHPAASAPPLPSPSPSPLTSSSKPQKQKTTHVSNVVPSNLRFHCPNIGCETSCKSQIKLDRHLLACKYLPPPPPQTLFRCQNPGCGSFYHTQGGLNRHLETCIHHHRQAPSSNSQGFISRLFGWNTMSSHTSFPSNPPVVAPPASSYPRPSPAPQTSSVASPATVPVPAPAPVASAATSHFSSPTKQTNRNSKSNGASSSSPQVLKTCGHPCSPSSLNSCCQCMDRRPMQQEGTYARYVDGEGWRNIGLRREGYCPICK